MVLGLRQLAERVGDGLGEPRLDADEGEELMHIQPGVAIALGRRPPESPGTLYISSRRVMWLSDDDRSKGYEVDFLSISLHAVSRDPEAYPSPCIYTQIETGEDEDEDSEEHESECAGDVELSKIREMRILPSDPSQLQALFVVFSKCAELNPDPNEELEEENEWFVGGDEMADDGDNSDWQFSENLANPIGHANGNHDITRSVLELQINDQRFEDAEEMEQNSHAEHQG